MTTGPVSGIWSRMACLAPHAPAETASAYSRIYAFGDSLSDAGNIFIASQGVLPDSLIYAHGRFSNGPVWVQDLAHDLRLAPVTPSLHGGTDFAYGGAETGNETLHGVLPNDLPSQLVQFLAQDTHPSANALYTLSVGGNDVIDAIDAYAGNPASATTDIAQAVQNETAFIGGLATAGAHTFAILNVPDLGKTPEEAGNAATASLLSALYDHDLAASLAKLQLADHLSLHLINAYGLIDNAVADPAAYHLTNVTSPVWTGNFYNPLSGHLNATGAAQNTYLFFDHLHPTETGHLALAGLALASLK